MLLEAGLHSEIVLIQYRATVPLDVAGASALLLFGSTVLRHGALQRKSDRASTMRTSLFMGEFFAPRLFQF